MTHTTTRAAAPAPERSADDLGWQLGTLLARWRESVADALAGIPAGPRGYHLLRAAAHAAAPPTQAALASHLGIDRTVMTYLLDDLCDAGLVERCPDPADRRVRRIAATDAGRSALADVEDRMTAAETEVLRGLSAGERDTLRTLLARTTGTAAPGEDRCAVVSG
ncbi:MarR family winged helix-turn-helix transcriptional regulator [Cellulomonas dongxiuzhuiae]|uniref:MarR family winged helix-turn-helix transcriptional regulator n=1 Tax=Cellulomonas dongxiuzhuiae TaxID=2819979 RepID=A0ABX8GI39_9CELL|nr:MarR family winged helix-turn-helix transcriptional regulator [Cellulomonas dongxiuzhuiae]MBO3087952.1 winged helix-turn-helix transcriptional regulator [Cellulomonas dongxiuzhuiae]MBO3094696.1 winged helix-turn-helix transcriptional regulator [Cellulomonas dongxiuzhuiae]QWC15699.1 MarR family winged helix-turn-helix transcriptional regulator [Cellulomonas dongxiuzhuiae]